jgi:glycosyltransferase involved in cell wall biosynthesis
LAAVIHSLLSQSFIDFELIISDNCSTDATASICAEYAKSDSRIKFFRQPRNIGPFANFEWVMRNSSSKSKYFMWAAHDDLRTANFLKECVGILESNLDCVAATSLDQFDNRDYVNAFEINGSKSERLLACLDHAFYSNGIFYSLIRAPILCRFDMDSISGIAGDWALIVYLASEGSIKRTSNAMLTFSGGGVSNTSKRYKAFRHSIFCWIFPLKNLAEYVLTLVKDQPRDVRSQVQRRLSKLNFDLAVDQAKVELDNFSDSRARYPLQFLVWFFGTSFARRFMSKLPFIL